MFYKLIDENTVEKFKPPLKVDGKHIFTNDEKILNENGYYKVIINPMPEGVGENKYWESKYIVIDNMIHKVWEEKEFEEIVEEEIIVEELPTEHEQEHN